MLLDDLYWLAAEGCEQPAVHRQMYEAGCYDVRVLSLSELCGFQDKLRSIADHPDMSAKSTTPWHQTCWTRDHLVANGFESVDKSTIFAVDDFEGKAIIVCVCTFGPSAEELFDLGRCAFGANGTVAHPDSAGQSVVGKRGAKRQGGKMLMYGTHNLFGQNAELLGQPRHWQPAAYLPDKPPCTILNEKVRALGDVMTELEKALTPAAAQARKERFDDMDPRRMHRISDACEGPAYSLATGYVVGPHPDSSVDNEHILFGNTEGPMPAGHSWSFAIPGFILELPPRQGDVVHISVAPHIFHGTLPSSSTQPHRPHGNLGAALVTRKDLVQAFEKQKERGDETPIKYTASHVYRRKSIHKSSSIPRDRITSLFKKLKEETLKQICNDLSLSADGSKDEVVARLCAEL